ncbi:MAG: 23S rRNA pseudouridine(955/2504/2580) synthase RluC [Methylococcales symbiont of Iophon sp. n. MRB-2018]|nr:MAG: 23S rRNA pseudouridine(955/2504/2580) synthase RluC [Methylococcales symbiont of Iophon sp. n. MRB-2018]KAF3979068.1 MAG: 23S rRNA pseudouridine(955/2504/2580) synthase RluC [Methylococcales symbiont of Iophon sp. n. MRB-2018]
MKLEENSGRAKVQWLEITEENSGQRIDNFLITLLKGVPKTRIYRLIRKGEVRVNKGRINNRYRLEIGDCVRVPPVRVAVRNHEVDLKPTLKYSLENGILYEDEVLMVLNKAAGFAVHGGSGISSGIIEALRVLRPDARFLELAHRLDKDTSGCLLIAKKRSALKALHDLFRGDAVKKTYLALLAGEWERKKLIVTEPLLRNTGKGGERIVKVSKLGKFSETHFRRIQKYPSLTLVEASPKTGRTHQIRVHAAWLGHPIVGDSRYGDEEINKKLRKKGFKRLFLHAQQLQFVHPVTGEKICFKAPLAVELQKQLESNSD